MHGSSSANAFQMEAPAVPQRKSLKPMHDSRTRSRDLGELRSSSCEVVSEAVANMAERIRAVLKSRSINQNFWSLNLSEHTRSPASCEMAYVPPHRRRQLAQTFQALGEKALRTCCWDALKVDDPGSLLGLLEAQGAAIEEARRD